MDKTVPEKDPATYSLITYSWVALVACLGGVVSFIRKVRDGVVHRFSITEFIGELITSAFAGLITFFMCEAAKLDPMLSAAFIGISGHMGSRAIFIIENYLLQKTKGKK